MRTCPKRAKAVQREMTNERVFIDGGAVIKAYEIIVQEHQGEMRVDSVEGEFTEFIILIPRAVKT